MVEERMSRRDYIRIVKQLYYSDYIIARLKEAKTETEMEHIMIMVRKSL